MSKPSDGEGHSVKKASFSSCCRGICKTARFDIALAKIKTLPFITIDLKCEVCCCRPLQALVLYE